MTPGTKSIDLIHCVKELEPEALELLEADANAANVNLHVLVDEKDRRLSGDRLREMFPSWKSASFWFCGPAAFGQSVRADLIAHGLATRDFHQELFNMR